MQYVYCPLADERNLDTYRFPDLGEPGRFESAKERLPNLKERYVVSAGTSTFFRHGWDLRGLENWLMDIVEESPFMLKLLDRLLEFKLEQIRRHHEGTGGGAAETD